MYSFDCSLCHKPHRSNILDRKITRVHKGILFTALQLLTKTLKGLGHILFMQCWYLHPTKAWTDCHCHIVFVFFSSFNCFMMLLDIFSIFLLNLRLGMQWIKEGQAQTFLITKYILFLWGLSELPSHIYALHHDCTLLLSEQVRIVY